MQAVGCRSSDFTCACSYAGRNQIIPLISSCIESTCNLPDEGRAMGFFDKMCIFADAFSNVKIVHENLDLRKL
ncbi:hypothetical protein P154DRAFT_526915 [Amniculicola lignicola CBS 123094]|uniref:CFEM domain-containing protein n=1 Tax=Amniculicola lignicola CBS 123094 TaxID=1392246 RepID=A0A6A5W170_9PLEO|nr:hypothetical protein P154DRAFT_526915 [Amniculicola lignicola CBS 123094]